MGGYSPFPAIWEETLYIFQLLKKFFFNLCIIFIKFISFFFQDSFQTAVSISSKGREALSETQKIIAGAIDALSRRQNLQVFVACALLLFAVYPVMFPAAEHSRFSLHHVFGKILYLIRIIGTFLASGFLFYGIFNVRDEYSVYKAVQEMINVQLKKMCNRKRMKENSNWLEIPESKVGCSLHLSSEWETFLKSYLQMMGS